MMRSAAWTVGLAVTVALVCCCRPCGAANETIGSSLTVSVNCWGGSHLDPVDDMIDDSVFLLHEELVFVPGQYDTSQICTDPQPTIYNAVEALGWGGGFAAWVGHGGRIGDFGVCWYYREDDRDLDYGLYSYEQEVEIVRVDDTQGATDYYGIAMLPALISSSSCYDDRTILVLSCCFGDSSVASWGAGAHLSYPGNMYWSDMKANLSAFCDRLVGESGREMRSTGNAVAGIPCSDIGREHLVLNPAVREMEPPLEELIGNDVDGYVEFDTKVQVDFPEDVLSSSLSGNFNPVFEFRNVVFIADTLLSFTIHPLYQASVDIAVDALEIHAQDVYSCFLNGNSDPPGTSDPWGPNCYPPDGDDYVTRYESTAGESPAAVIVECFAVVQGGGVGVSWRTTSERDSDYFTVYSSSDLLVWSAVSGQIEAVAAPGQGAEYAWFDPDGQDGTVYKLFEVELDGDAGWYPEFVAGPYLRGPVGSHATEAQEIQEAVVQVSPHTMVLERRREPMSDPEAVIVTPATWVTEVLPLADHWEAERGITGAAVVTLEEIGPDPTAQEIKDYVLGLSDALEYVLLVGRAHPLDPERDLLPGYYVSCTECDPFGTHIWDGWYGDVNDDEVPEIAVGRMLADSAADVSASVAKSISYDYLQSSQWRRSALTMIETRNLNGCSGAWVSQLAEALSDSLPATLEKYILRTKDVSGYHDPANLIAAGVDYWNMGHHVVLALGSLGTPHWLVGFFDKPNGFTTDLISGQSGLPVVVGASCDLADHLVSHPTYGDSNILDFQTEPEKCSLAWIGMVESTEQWSNYIMAREFVRRIDMDGTLSLGEIWRCSIESAWAGYPQDRKFIKRWSLFGDPTLRLSWTDTPTATPELPGKTEAIALASCPNPSGADGVAFTVRGGGRTRVSIYGANGRLIATILDEDLGSAPVSIRWDGRDDAGNRVATGVYFAQLVTPSGTATSKVVLIR